VLAARDVGGTPTLGGLDTTSAPGAVMKQLHEVVDNIARLWAPTSRPAPSPASPSYPAAASGASLPQLQPSTALRPGERATIGMTIRNNEQQKVRLKPIATPLIGSTGERIPAQLIEFTPKEMVLDPGASQDLRIDVVVPGLGSPGCYSGLMVVSGVDYLRALLTIEVVGNR
jgi:hypothetical protein